MAISPSHLAWQRLRGRRTRIRMVLRSNRVPLITLVVILMTYVICSSLYLSPARPLSGFSGSSTHGKAKLGASQAEPLPYPPIDPLTGNEPPSRARKYLPHIPTKIWQIYLAPNLNSLPHQWLHSWISMSPSYTYTVLDAAAGHELIASALGPDAEKHYTQDALELYYMISRQVMRVDFLRYLALAVHGGVYSDTDTNLVKPIHEWVPEHLREKTRVIVGVEADQSPPVGGTTFEVQFCQWTLAGAKDHPLYWAMVDRILSRIRQRKIEAEGIMRTDDKTNDGKEQEIRDAVKLHFSDQDILDVTGPAGWSRLLYEHFNNVTGTEVTWRNFTGMREPRLVGDILVLPIDGFATGVPHSGASVHQGTGTMALHMFSGSWKGGNA